MSPWNESTRQIMLCIRAKHRINTQQPTLARCWSSKVSLNRLACYHSRPWSSLLILSSLSWELYDCRNHWHSRSSLRIDTTPQAPENIRFEQRSANLFLSWQAGYDGGRSQHFILWYRLISKKKENWNQILILPGNATEFLLFDLKVRETYEVTIVAENDLGLGTFSSIVTVHMNPSSDLPIDYLYHSNETDLHRPPPPRNLRLFHSGSNLHVTWDHSDSSVQITHYVLRWRSTILFNNEGSQRFLVLPYPIHSYLLKEIKQSKYTIQLLAYSNEGTYSVPIESEINIRTSSTCLPNEEILFLRFFFSPLEFHSILAYHGSISQLVSILCFLSVVTIATLCIGIFLAIRYYHRRQSYWTDLESGNVEVHRLTSRWFSSN